MVPPATEKKFYCVGSQGQSHFRQVAPQELLITEHQCRQDGHALVTAIDI